jgi:hypothetical protein
MRLPILLAALPVVLAFYGCGSSSDNSGPSDSGAPDAVDAPSTGDDASEGGSDAGADTGYPAPHSPMPQAETLNGPVMTAPKIVAITFAGDPLIPSITDFVSKTGTATSYWSGATSEYGVGPIASTTTLTYNETPAANLQDSDVQAWLTGKLNPAADAGADAQAGADGGSNPSLPPPDVNTQYVIFYPSGVTVTDQGQPSCGTFMGYHGNFSLGASFVTYAVIPRCPPPGPGVSAIDAIAAVTSHEFIEAATDPLGNTNPAWTAVDPDHIAWSFLGGSEIGDLCAAFPDSFYKPADLPYLVQRV